MTDTQPDPAAQTLSADRLKAIETRLLAAFAARPDDVQVLRSLGSLRLAQGDLKAGAELYRRLVALAPDDADARHTLGQIAREGGDRTEAEASFRRAIEAYPAHLGALIDLSALLIETRRIDDALPWLDRAAALAMSDVRINERIGATYLEAGKLENALAIFDKALGADPGDAASLKGKGKALLGLKKPMEAAPLLHAAAEALPQDLEIRFTLGNAYGSLGRHADAQAAYEAALAILPDIPEVLVNLASVESAQGRHEAAAGHALRATVLQPDLANAWNNLGLALGGLGRPKEAKEAYERSVALDPMGIGALVNLGHAYKVEARLDDAIGAFERANDVSPSPAAWNGIGQVYQHSNRQKEAIAAFERALELEPENAQIHNNLAISYQELAQYAEAIKHYMRAIEIDPGVAEIHYNLATLVQLLGRYEDVVGFYQRALRLRPDMNAIYPNLMHVQMNLCMWQNLESIMARVIENTETELAHGEKPSAQYFALLSTPASAELRLRVARKISESYALKVKDAKRQLAFRHRKDGPKIRIGYISPDFRLHSVAAAFRGLLDAHDRQDFEWYGYSLAPFADDEMTRHFQATFHRFHDVSRMTFPEAGKLINDDGIHLLIDLAGHTRNNRFEILALEPAPVQIHYLGFGATLGADYIPYLIVDPVEMPPDLARHCSEAVVLLPDTFMATTRTEPADKSFTRAELGLPEAGVVFCNFNSHSKFHPAIFDVWMRLLRRQPASVLWMIEGPPTAMNNLRAEAQARNVDPSRLIFAPKWPLPLHLARLKHADIALDTLYHAGGVTTVDALRIGLPIVVLAGDTPNGRTGASLVSAIGAPELIARDLDSYEALAQGLAADRPRREALRAKLLAARDVEPLFDVERLARHLESAYREIWRRHLDGLAPEGFAVPPLPRNAR